MIKPYGLLILSSHKQRSNPPSIFTMLPKYKLIIIMTIIVIIKLGGAEVKTASHYKERRL